MNWKKKSVWKENFWKNKSAGIKKMQKNGTSKKKPKGNDAKMPSA